MAYEAETIGHGFHVGLQGAGQALVGAWMLSRQNAQASEADQQARQARLRAAASRGAANALRDSNERLRDRLDEAYFEVEDMREQRNELLAMVEKLKEDKMRLGRALVAERSKAAVAA